MPYICWKYSHHSLQDCIFFQLALTLRNFANFTLTVLTLAYLWNLFSLVTSEGKEDTKKHLLIMTGWISLLICVHEDEIKINSKATSMSIGSVRVKLGQAGHRVLNGRNTQGLFTKPWVCVFNQELPTTRDDSGRITDKVLWWLQGKIRIRHFNKWIEGIKAFHSFGKDCPGWIDKIGQ